MICEIIFFKKSAKFSWFFVVRVLFIWFCYEQQFFETVKSPKIKYLETHLFLKKILQTDLKILSAQINCSLSELPLFSQLQNTRLGVIFCVQKLVFTFFQVWLFNFIAILKNVLKIYLEKLRKDSSFTHLSKSLEPYKLP